MATKNDEEDNKLPFGLPPIMPDVKTELTKYITDIERLRIYHLDNIQCHLPRESNVLSLLHFDLAPIGTTIKFDRNPITGELGDMKEVTLKGAGETSKNSMSMNRAPGPVSEQIRGNSNNFPFWPGGFDEPDLTETTTVEEIDFENNLRNSLPGSIVGIEFHNDNCTPVENTTTNSKPSSKEKVKNKSDKINLMAIVHEEETMLGLLSSKEKIDEPLEEKISIDEPSIEKIVDFSVELMLPDLPVLNITESSNKMNKSSTKWAEMLDVTNPVTDFEKILSNPAMKFDYELDTFQKQAIIQLEKSCNVFVAAHTSAGKTTVAEYAIALSQKHMTRVIYTSPIKALSNQKYRDFKNKFESVGLLTGDFQINQTSSCLIMTTEILQSMLYCASEILRDLEFVIFDEVHYINDEDRGHVWEEILILLPHSVNIVMLSATVPNPLVFANWVGRIKRRKMYVISTLKRPIPLQHYLYTGTSKASANELFLILDREEKFRMDEWMKATEREKSKKNTKIKRFNPAQEKVLWTGFFRHLQSQNLLPVVIFTLSRQRCDSNASILTNLDLTNSKEQHHVHVFFKKAISCLKGPDRDLPQVRRMEDLLKRGIGIHHSGILPILKEIVEMLFQNGFVKVLFATETFAMGVNMPTRTVVFDSIRKFDGTEFRTLHPTEYIQMAGRAGRRGHDTTGTVIIMCRNDIPHSDTLKSMMCGQPESLQSQFKVTYRMVLNLRRANDTVSVEAMMRRSFGEYPLVSKQNVFEMELHKIDQHLIDFPELSNLQLKLEEFCKTAMDYLEDVKMVQPHLYRTKYARNAMKEGRVLLISYSHHYNKLAILLNIINQKNSQQYKVFVLTDYNSFEERHDYDDNDSLLYHKIISLTRKHIFLPGGVPSHEILTISSYDIIKITKRTIDVDCNLVLRDWENRQIQRFRNNPPGSMCQLALHKLIELSYTASNNPQILTPYVQLKIDACNDTLLRMQHMDKLYNALANMRCVNVPNFEDHFQLVFQKGKLESKRRQLQINLSDEGLSLYPNYISMVKLLKELRYIEHDERIALKGRVALQMGTNELLITELILKNILTVLQPAEIAALLSAIIFQHKTSCPFEMKKLTPELQNGCEQLVQVHDNLERLELEYNLCSLQPLNFGLVKVVYEWAQSMSFAEIMEFTDIQEGIIVKCIQKLNETLSDVKSAAVTIGDPVLKDKMEAASLAIKRDIVFVASLYTQD